MTVGHGRIQVIQLYLRKDTIQNPDLFTLIVKVDSIHTQKGDIQYSSMLQGYPEHCRAVAGFV